jgi:hypothetical protein
MDLLKLWKETFQNPARDKYASKSKHAAYVTVILLLNRDYSKVYNTQRFQVMRWQVL